MKNKDYGNMTTSELFDELKSMIESMEKDLKCIEKDLEDKDWIKEFINDGIHDDVSIFIKRNGKTDGGFGEVSVSGKASGIIVALAALETHICDELDVSEELFNEIKKYVGVKTKDKRQKNIE